MEKSYELDKEDEEILNELDNLYGVVQNKEVLRDIITYAKLKEAHKLDFGNYNIIIRNDSSYNLLDDFLKVCAKLFMKYNIISNDKICHLDKMKDIRGDSPFDKIEKIEESIIVINEEKLEVELTKELDNLSKVIKQYKDKVFIFEDTSFCIGEMDSQLWELATWRMTIEKVSLEDKIMYCKKKFEENNLEYNKQDLRSFADVPFWVLKNMIIKLIIECKSQNINLIDRQMLKKNKGKFDIENTKRSVERKNEKVEKMAKAELNELIGLDNVKTQIEKILNYIKLNKERGKMPTLHMCFTGNPGTGKTSIARVIGKLFKQENILNGGDFVEIHGRDLVAKYVGWTAQKVHSTVEKAIGGVLFIDEAYSLISDRRGSFEDEAIATLIKEMEDHRDEICIIFAGYTEEMNEFIKLNPGFESRIQFTINFPDYNEEELLKIFTGLCEKEHYKLSSACKKVLINNFKVAKNKENFGNGRYVRNLFEKIKFEQADRVLKNKGEDINLIKKSDIEKVVQNLEEKEVRKNTIGFAC